MDIKSTEFFKNLKSIPPEDTREFSQLIDWEIEKISGGVTVNGVYISGWLYWHLNHWWIRIDDVDEYGNIIRKPSLPELRDNEWIRAEILEKCRIERKGYIEVGGRQGGKSEMEASYFGMNATLFSNTQNLIICGNDNDLSLIKDKVDFGLKHLWKGIAIPRLDKTWRLNQIRLGYKKPDGDDEIWSYIIIRNARDGNSTEVAAGATVKTFIMDEVGKYPFASTFKAGEPTIKSAYGYRTVPILVGTGGSFDDGRDAENFFYNPESNTFLPILDETTNKNTGLFLSGLYRMDCKYSTNLADWLKQEKNLTLKDDRELKKIAIHASDKEKSLKLIEEERDRAKANPDRNLYLKQVMYYPLTVDECFLSSSQNIFDIDSLKRQKNRLTQLERTGTPVVLYLTEDGVVTHEFTDKMPISHFPLQTGDSKDAPVVIYEFPVENPPYGLYTAGCLLPGEKVLTEKGLEDIEKVTLNNKLINKDGNLVDIYNLQRYYKQDEDIYTIKVSNTNRTTTFTKEHPIYVSDAYGNNAEPIIESRFKFDFVEAKDIKVNQWIKVPNIYKTKNNFDIDILWNNFGYRIDRHVKSPLKDKDFWWFVGLWLGDGYCLNNSGRISISLNLKEKDIINRLGNIVNRLFNRAVSNRIRNNCVEVSFNFEQLHDFLSLHFGKFAIGKYISEWAKKINDDCKYQLLLGYLDSDGCMMHDKKRNYYGLDFVSINLRLLEDIQDIFFSIGIVSGINVLREKGEHYFDNRETKSITQKTYQLRVGHNQTIEFAKHFNNNKSYKLCKIDFNNLKDTVASPKKGCFISEDKKYIYFKIKDIKKSIYTGWVYNFECETNSYMCHRITTHNCDPYRQGQAKYSSSLGAIYIYKRMHSLTGEKYQDMFVASYVARPDKKETWEEQARLLIKYYNARVLCENDDISFIEYMKAKGDAHYLEKQPEWLLEIVPNTTVKREYGVHRSSQKIIDYLHTCYKKYMEESIYTEKDEQGNITREVLGVYKIFDVLLLEETIQYKDDEGNYDRVIAAELAIAQAIKMDPIIGRVGGSDDDRVKSLYVTRSKPSLFNSNSSAFTRRKQKLFA